MDFADQQVWRGGYVRAGLRGLGSRRVELVADDVYADDDGSDERDEDEQAPAGAEAVFADEDLVDSRRRRGWDGFVGSALRHDSCGSLVGQKSITPA